MLHTHCRKLTLLAAMAAVSVLSGCASVEPWVKPWEMERFADPIMNPSRGTLSARHFAHTREVREAARGANDVSGGGCGCK